LTTIEKIIQENKKIYDRRVALRFSKVKATIPGISLIGSFLLQSCLLVTLPVSFAALA
jgi:hypothetical protein